MPSKCAMPTPGAAGSLRTFVRRVSVLPLARTTRCRTPVARSNTARRLRAPRCRWVAATKAGFRADVGEDTGDAPQALYGALRGFLERPMWLPRSADTSDFDARLAERL